MKKVSLFEFFKCLADKGVNLAGCEVHGINDGLYEFSGLSETHVKVKYGAERKMIGNMSKNLLVEKISFKNKTENNLAERTRNSGITVHYVEDPSRR